MHRHGTDPAQWDGVLRQRAAAGASQHEHRAELVALPDQQESRTIGQRAAAACPTCDIHIAAAGQGRDRHLSAGHREARADSPPVDRATQRRCSRYHCTRALAGQSPRPPDIPTNWPGDPNSRGLDQRGEVCYVNTRTCTVVVRIPDVGCEPTMAD